MAELFTGAELTGRPVVTLDGEAVAQIKDTVVDALGGRVAGFTLAGRGLFAGPLRRSLPWTGVHALGPAAVMIPTAEVLVEPAAIASATEASHGRLHGATVLTDRGVAVGTVLDVVIASGGSGLLVGVEIASTEALRKSERTLYLALRGEPAMTGDTLVIPEEDTCHVAENLTEFAHVLARMGTADPFTPRSTEKRL
ncbi:PRC-barrel domain-containing protein [Streptomyces sp. NPDC047017]|uniref:PRC-barrel domain-containing protein n=1 Tax=Streptomyces sp. NPDC047017 TaxID=3155024 RepID=UPI0034006831